MYLVRTRRLMAVTILLAVGGLTACGGSSSPASGGTSAAAGGGSKVDVSKVNPCSLLTAAEVATLAPGLKPHMTKTAAVKICNWSDSQGHSVMVLANPSPGVSLKTDIKDTIGAFGGYAIISVPGLGDEAAAAFQKANPSKGISAGLAGIEARSGNIVVTLSTPTVKILQGSAEFEQAKKLTAKALARAVAAVG